MSRCRHPFPPATATRGTLRRSGTSTPSPTGPSLRCRLEPRSELLFELGRKVAHLRAHLLDLRERADLVEPTLLGVAVTVGLELPLVRLLHLINRRLGIEQQVVREPRVSLQRVAFFSPEEMCQRVRRARVERPQVNHERVRGVRAGVFGGVLGEIRREAQQVD